MSIQSEVEPLTGRIAAVSHMTGTSHSTIRRWVKKGILPPPFRLTPEGSPMWLLSEVRARIEQAAGRPISG